MLKNYINNLLFKLSNYINRSIDLKNYEDKELILLAKNLMNSNSWFEKANFERSQIGINSKIKEIRHSGKDWIIVNF